MKPGEPRFVPRLASELMTPCPFCGSVDLGFYEYVYAGQFAVTCRACGAQGPSRQFREKAIALWNERR